ncbi:unnamed protein product [Effrenium voratum]|uniref:Uncharacterized protein n=1 Tax=Effrenium voratum TaxID=2562239 RepID=A0AA36MNX5_9DINO|nr:unnamed protein product [Effrenium voratum]
MEEDVTKATEALLSWGEAALGCPSGGCGGPGGPTSVALAVAKLEDPEMKRLHQELQQLEAEAAAARRRRLAERISAAACEADLARAEEAPEMRSERQELESMESEAAETAGALKRCDLRLQEVQRYLKGRASPGSPGSPGGAEAHAQLLRALEAEELRAEEEIRGLRSELQEERGGLVDDLRCRLAVLEERKEQTAQKAKECSMLRSTAAKFKDQLQRCNGRVGELEAALASLTKVLSTVSAELEALELQNAALKDTHADHADSSGTLEALKVVQERQQELSEEFRESLEASTTDDLERCLQESRAQKEHLKEALAEVHARLIGAERCEELQRSAFEMRDEIHALTLAEAERKESSELQRAEVKVAEEALVDDLRAKLEARERRVQLLAARLRQTQATSWPISRPQFS